MIIFQNNNYSFASSNWLLKVIGSPSDTISKCEKFFLCAYKKKWTINYKSKSVSRCIASNLWPREQWAYSLVTQSCLTLCYPHPMDCRLPGSSVHGIFRARVLEWIAISFSRGSSQPRNGNRVSHIVGRCFTVWATMEIIISIIIISTSICLWCSYSFPGLGSLCLTVNILTFNHLYWLVIFFLADIVMLNCHIALWYNSNYSFNLRPNVKHSSRSSTRCYISFHCVIGMLLEKGINDN